MKLNKDDEEKLQVILLLYIQGYGLHCFGCVKNAGIHIVRCKLLNNGINNIYGCENAISALPSH